MGVRHGLSLSPSSMMSACLQHAVMMTVLCLVTCHADQLVQYHIQEELPLHSLVGDISLSAGLNPSTPLEFQFLSDSATYRQYFSLDSHSGVLRTAKRIDRDALCVFADSCELSLDITVQGEGSLQIVKIIVGIEDVNDNQPEFPEDRHVLYLSETTEIGTPFSLPNAEDPDSGDYGIQTYALTDFQDKFGVRVTDDGSVQLVLKQKLDREEQAFYVLQLTASDGDGKKASLDIELTVLDMNDNSPTFEKDEYEVFVDEDLPVSSTILQVHANDPDEGANGEVMYSFSRNTATMYGNMFELNTFTGVITTLAQFNYAENTEYNLALAAKDQGPSSLAGYTKVTIKVRDLNDHAPKITVNALSPRNTAVVSEHAGRGTFVAHVSVSDADGGDNGQFRCQLDNPNFELYQIYPTEYKVLTTVDFDRESQDNHELYLSCEDKGEIPQSSRQKLVVEVSDINDHSPQFSQPLYKIEILENNAVNIRLLQVNATDADIGNNGRIQYTLEGKGFHNSQLNIEADTGIITTQLSLDHEERAEWEFHVVAADQGSPVALSSTATLLLTITDVNDEAPMFPQSTFTFNVMENQSPDTVLGDVVAYDSDSAPFNVITYSLDRIGSQYFKIDPVHGTVSTLQELDREHRASYSFNVIASNVDDGLKSFAQVQVVVKDQNDNAPVIDFPHGDTVDILASAKVGTEVTRVKAHDADSAENSQLRFTILSSTIKNIFSLNPMSGSLTVKEELYDYVDQSVAMTVRVSDRGRPEALWTVEELNVFINGTGAAARQAGTIELNKTSMIIIILLSVTAVVSLVLIITIVFLIRRRRRLREAQSKMTPKYTVQAYDDLEAGDQPELKDVRTSTPNGKAGVYAGIPTVDGQLGNMKQPYVSSMTTLSSKPSQDKTRRVHFNDNNRSISPYIEQAPGKAHRVPSPVIEESESKRDSRHLTQVQLQAHDFLHYRDGGVDQESDRGSSADSGRGASEEEGNNTSTDSIPPPRSSQPNQDGCPKHAASRTNTNAPGPQCAKHTSHRLSDPRNIGAYSCKDNLVPRVHQEGVTGHPAPPVPQRNCKVHGLGPDVGPPRPPQPGNFYEPSVGNPFAQSYPTDVSLDNSLDTVDMDDNSDGGSTTSGEYVVNLEDFHNEPSISQDVFV